MAPRTTKSSEFGSSEKSEQLGSSTKSADGILALAKPSLAPLLWRAERLGSSSAWWEHVPFAHWLVNAAAPRCIVELGTHAGVSYSAFCTAVATARLGTRCFAIDTWRGDEHSGHYDMGVFEEFRRFHDERFSTFSTLIRSTFDEALEKVADGSVDLLHIDGLHTYEAVLHDYTSWLPKLSNRAVVLFHDINEHGDSSFGVWRLWAELRSQYPHFEFINGHGLGLLAVGRTVPREVAELCAIHDAPSKDSIRRFVARLGERWRFETLVRMSEAAIVDAKNRFAEQERHRFASEAKAAEVEARNIDLAGSLVRLKAELETLRQERAEVEGRAVQAEQKLHASEDALENRFAEQERHRFASEAKAAEVEARNIDLAGSLVRLKAELETLRQERAEVEGRGAVQAEQKLHASEDALVNRFAEQERHRFASEAKAGEVEARNIALTRSEVRLKSELETLRREIPRNWSPEAARAVQAERELSVRVTQAETARINAERERDAVTSSTLWRATSPIRAVGPWLPAPVRRYARAMVSKPLPLRLSIRWISGEPNTPGHKYRVERPLAAAAALGLDAAWIGVGDVGEKLNQIETADIIVLWRTVWNDVLAAAVNNAKSNGTKVVFDIDDLMVDPELARLEVIDGIRSQGLTEETVRAHYAGIRAAMASADLCIASTEELALHMRRAMMPALVLPNSFDERTRAASRIASRIRASERRPAEKPIRIGYAGGSRTHQKDFAVCVDAVAEILRDHPNCRLVLFKVANITHCLDVDEFPVLQGLHGQIEWREFVPLDQLPNEIAQFDVNLVPLEVGNPFCEAKSELKYFEAALAGVPTIASPTGPYRRAIRHGETGFLAETSSEWRDALERLVGNADLRTQIAAAAELDVSWRFGVENTRQQMSVILDLLRGGESAAKAFQLWSRSEVDHGIQLPQVPPHETLFDHDSLGIAQVAIVIPLYNYANTQTEALESVKMQSVKVLDLVIVDDNSTDESLELALTWARTNKGRFNRVRVVRNLANQGLGAARNVGFALADTPWIMTLDADNRLRPGCVEACLATVNQTCANFAYPYIQEFGDKSDRRGFPGWEPARLLGGNYIDAMALVSRAGWAGVGGYSTARISWEDYDLWCLFAERGLRGERVPGEPLAEYRVHGDSMTTTFMDKVETVRWIMSHVQSRHAWLKLISPIPEPIK